MNAPVTSLRRLHLAVLLASALVVLAAVGGCDTVSPEPTSEVVVEAYLIADEPLPGVRLTRSVAASDRFTPADAAVRGADVAIQQLNDAGAVAATYPYEESDSLSVYQPVDEAPTVQPQTRYRLQVRTTEGATVQAETTVPGRIDVLRVANTDVTYQGGVQPQFVIRPARGTTRPSTYAFAITAQLDFDATSDEALAEALTPFYADVYDPDETDIAEFERVASPLINEASFTFNDDGTITLDVPWIGFAFYGANTVTINAPDENYYDLVRTQDAQQGGLAPGEIPNVIDRVEGGTGIFGSLSRAGTTITVRRPPGL